MGSHEQSTLARIFGLIFLVLLGLLATPCLVYPQGPAPDRYVDATTGSDLNDGSSWGLATQTIEAALDTLGPEGGTIHVAAGEYVEHLVVDRDLWLLGGYPEGGGERNPTRQESVIRAPTGRFGSVIHVTEDARGKQVRIDGFSITGGVSGRRQVYWPEAGRGGGIRVEAGSVSISNNRIFENVAEFELPENDVKCPNVAYTHRICVMTCTGLGGGIYVGEGTEQAKIVNNLVESNEIRIDAEFHPFDGEWCYGRDYLSEWGCSQEVIDSMPPDCDGRWMSGTNIYVDAGAGPVEISNNTIVEGELDEYPGGDLFVGTSEQQVVQIERNIVSDYRELGPGEAHSSYNRYWSDVEGGPTDLIGVDPGFLDRSERDYRLRQVLAGQSQQSEMVDAGDLMASSVCIPHEPGLCMNSLSTRSDGVGDGGIVDLGFHSWADHPVERETNRRLGSRPSDDGTGLSDWIPLRGDALRR